MNTHGERPSIRGSLITTAREAATELWGPPALGHIGERLSPGARAAIVEPVMIREAWVPEANVLEWYEAVLSGPCAGSRTLYFKYLQLWMDLCFGRVRRLLLSMVGPAGILERAEGLWRYDHTTGVLKATVESQSGGSITLSDHPYLETPLARESIAEIIRHILSRSRARRVTSTHALDGKGQLVVTFRWS